MTRVRNRDKCGLTLSLLPAKVLKSKNWKIFGKFFPGSAYIFNNGMNLVRDQRKGGTGKYDESD